MAKSKKTAEPYKDAEQGAGNGYEERGSRGEDRDWEIGGPAADLRILKRTICGVLVECLDQVDPEIAKNNPVWKWALCDDHCTFVFRDGRKAVINF